MKKQLIATTYKAITNEIQDKKSPLYGIEIIEARGFCGPRVAAIEICVSGRNINKALSILQSNNCAFVRQFFGWDFPGSPNVFLSGKYIRIEAAWNEENATTRIPLSSLSTHPNKNGTFTIGLLESGQTMPIQFDNITPHIGIVGLTGSGKSVLLASIIAQLHEQVDLVIIDMKGEPELLQIASKLRKVAPVARNEESAVAAIQWVIAQLRKRYSQVDGSSIPTWEKIVVVVDEVSFLVDNKEAQKGLQEIARLGRSANIHLALATQDAKVDSFGGSAVIKNLSGRLVGHVSDALSSYYATGLKAESGIDASNLQMQGDFYVVVPGVSRRVQVAYLDNNYKLPDKEVLQMESWPNAKPETKNSTPPISGGLSSELWEAAIYIASTGKGRRGRSQLVNLCKKNGIDYPSDTVAQSAIMKKARQLVDGYNEDVCLFEEETPIPIENWPKKDVKE